MKQPAARRRYRVHVQPGDAYLVPGDIHFPQHDAPRLAAMVQYWDRHPATRKGVVLQGDTLDCFGLSRFPKAARRVWLDSRLKDEVTAATPFLVWASQLPLGCTMILGNHEDRLARALDDIPALDGCRTDFGALTGLDQIPGLDILDHASWVILGDKVGVCHGDAKGFPRTPRLVAQKYPDQVTMYGHTHGAGSHLFPVYDMEGRPQIRGAYNVGHLQDPDQVDYAFDPSGWVPGFAEIEFHGDRGDGAPMFSIRQRFVFPDAQGVMRVV